MTRRRHRHDLCRYCATKHSTTPIHRTLASERGGTLRLSTPDLAIYAAAYFDPNKRFFKEHYDILTENTPSMAEWMTLRRAHMVNQIFR